MKNLNLFLAGLLVLIAIGISALVVYTTTTRPLTAVEGILWQVFALTTGLAGSFIFGHQSAREAAKEIIMPHVQSAFRRLDTLYRSLSRAADVIESPQNTDSPEDYKVALARLEEIIAQQLMTADDALEDWKDLAPEDVAKLNRKLPPDNTMEEKQ